MVNGKWINSTWLVALLLVACKPSATLDETSPKFYFPSDSVYTAFHDTLRLSGNVRDGFRLDSITAGDTATLHVGATTEEALLRVGDTVAEDVLGVLKGRPPMHPYTGPAPELR